MEHTFSTEQPVRLSVELGPGSLEVEAADVTTTTVRLAGAGADDAVVTQEGDQISVSAPHQRSMLGQSTGEVHARVVVPRGSQVITSGGSATQDLRGELRLVRASSGSGDIAVEHAAEVAELETGSGQVRLGTAGGPARLRTGSGDVNVSHALGELTITTGSGDVTIGNAEAHVAVKTGSGSLRTGVMRGDLIVTTGSGDTDVERLELGSIHAKAGSGSIRVGVAPDIPVWTDISTRSGQIASDLVGAGEPAPGAAHLEIRARTGSGDVTLEQR